MAEKEDIPEYCADFIDEMVDAFEKGESIDLDSYTEHMMNQQGCTMEYAEEMVNDCASMARGRIDAKQDEGGGGMKTKTRNLSKRRRKNTMKRKRNTKRRTRKLTKKRKLSKKRKKKTKRR